MKIKNLLLLVVLLNGFAARPSFGAGVRVAPGELEVAGEDTGSAGAGAGAGGAAEGVALVEGLPAEGVVGRDEPTTIATEGPLAKIELLRGSLTGAPPAMQGASLLHGAMLWETGIVKSLYGMLIKPKEDGGRIVPDAAICPLGEVLNELFYLAGGSFKISGMRSSLAQRLDAAGFGCLYSSILYNTDIALPVSKKHGSKNRALKKMFESCRVIDALNPENLLPSIIASCFWAKYVMADSVSVEQARENIAAFNIAAHSVVPSTAPALPVRTGAGTGAGSCAGGTFGNECEAVMSSHYLAALEEEMVARISCRYKYNIPAPIESGNIQGSAVTDDLRMQNVEYPDCAESVLRNILCTAFYNPLTQRFDLSAEPGLYSADLKEYFLTYPSVEDQRTDSARNAWAMLCSGKGNIVKYITENRWELDSEFYCVIRLLAYFVPASAPLICDCRALRGADSLGALDVRHSEECCIEILKDFCEMHNLEIDNFEINFLDDRYGDDSDNYADDGLIAQWHMKGNKPENNNCSMYVFLGEEHAYAQLKGLTISNFAPIQDPILGGSDALAAVPASLNLISPLVFAAAQIAGKENVSNAYYMMISVMNHDPLVGSMVENVWAWRSIISFQAYNEFTELKKSGKKAIIRYLIDQQMFTVVRSLLGQGFISNDGEPLLTYVAKYSHVGGVRFCLQNGAAVNEKMLRGKQHLM